MSASIQLLGVSILAPTASYLSARLAAASIGAAAFSSFAATTGTWAQVHGDFVSSASGVGSPFVSASGRPVAAVNASSLAVAGALVAAQAGSGFLQMLAAVDAAPTAAPASSRPLNPTIIIAVVAGLAGVAVALFVTIYVVHVLRRLG